MRKMLNGLKKITIFSVVLLLLCGIMYPLLVTGISQLLFPNKANGSIINVNGKEVGSELVGQDFTDERFMKCRPSAVNYNTYTEEEKKDGTYTGVSSGSDNYAPSNPELITRVKEDMDEFLKNNPDVTKEDIPTDLLTASGSGLDPHISPESAKVQIPALAKSTGLSENELQEIVDNNTKDKFLGVFGEKTVNVLKVNLEIAKRLEII
ncbi:potassium-transporting ATPase subunit C [uncultured Clostridium sp.]|uniref:K(+)-transporting ATPase subunit C n=1 Tax=uncultured Clostridium sp. TaxID=59620 RepID=UPI000820AFDA|nr:K(+)-transporting ATPase subunit C [uncultured Clostridium sp.]SCJ50510.1 potassium-transporting ATPase subunit C [uncultured Clostridium sp.]